MSKCYIEPFTQFTIYDRGIPFLASWTNRKTMHTDWSDGTLRDYAVFNAELDCIGMNQKLHEIWQRHLSQYDRRACFISGGGSSGGLVYVPIACGQAALVVVREHFNRALARIAPRPPPAF